MKKDKLPSRDSNALILTAINIGGALEWYEIGMFISWQLIIQQSAINFEAIAASLNVGAVLLTQVASSSEVLKRKNRLRM